MLALVPPPGYPAQAYVHPNGRIYEGTYESDAGAGVPSRVFEYSGGGRLIRTFTIRGQELGQPHGIQAALSDDGGRLVLLDTGPARVLLLDPATGRQANYATFPDLPLCPPGETGPDCSPATVDERPVPNYAAWGPDGSLYVTDYLQAVVWRVPPGGGAPEVWLADRKLDGVDFGTTGIKLAADRRTLLVAQGSSAGGGDGNPATGKIYEVPIRPNGDPGEMRRLWESGPTEVPDGFAIARSGRLYVPMVGTTAQIAVVAPDGTELERFPEEPFTGENGSSVPFDSPSSADVPRHAADRRQPERRRRRSRPPGDPRRRGRRARPAPADPGSRAGRAPGTVVCKVRRIRPARGPVGRAVPLRDDCKVRIRTSGGPTRYRLRSRGRTVDRGRARAVSRDRVVVEVDGVIAGRYKLIVGRGDGRRIRAVRVLLPL